MKCASKIMGQVWGIGKRRFNSDWRMTVWMSDILSGQSYVMKKRVGNGRSIREWQVFKKGSLGGSWGRVGAAQDIF